MLGKLVKYDFKATGRTLLPLYGALIVLAIINKLFIGIKLDGANMDLLGGIPAFLSMFAYGCTMAAVFIVTLFVIVQRFYKNLLGDEGYLMNTLPVEVWKNIASKLIVGIIWTIVSLIVAMISIFIMVVTPAFLTDVVNVTPELFREISAEIGIEFVFILIKVALLVLTSIISYILMLYVSISIGQLFNKRKILASFGAFIVINMIVNTIMIIGQMAFFGVGSMFFDESIFIYLFEITIILNLICSVIYFIVCNYILKNKLNLD
ncbi:MAG: ABC transporter permease [Clostridium sp.]